jgi:protein translocase SecG subunit
MATQVVLYQITWVFFILFAKNKPICYHVQHMESVTKFIPWIQIIISILLTISILLQQSGAGIGSGLGGGDSAITYHTRRGLERVLFVFSIILSILLVGSSLFLISIK